MASWTRIGGVSGQRGSCAFRYGENGKQRLEEADLEVSVSHVD